MVGWARKRRSTNALWYLLIIPGFCLMGKWETGSGYSKIAHPIEPLSPHTNIPTYKHTSIPTDLQTCIIGTHITHPVHSSTWETEFESWNTYPRNPSVHLRGGIRDTEYISRKRWEQRKKKAYAHSHSHSSFLSIIDGIENRNGI